MLSFLNFSFLNVTNLESGEEFLFSKLQFDHSELVTNLFYGDGFYLFRHDVKYYLAKMPILPLLISGVQGGQNITVILKTILKKISQVFYLVFRPIIFVLKKLVGGIVYLFGDAWSNKNKLTTIVCLISFVIFITSALYVYILSFLFPVFSEAVFTSVIVPRFFHSLYI